MKTKTILATLLAMILSIFLVSATYADSFSLSDVEVVDQNTLSVSFSNELLEDVSFFDFVVSDVNDSRELSIREVSSNEYNSVYLHLEDDLDTETEYELLVLFASDIEMNLIENGVEGMMSFMTPSAFDEYVESGFGDDEEFELNAAEDFEEGMNNSENGDENEDDVELNAAESEDLSVEEVASDAEVLPTTGPKEMMFVLFAMLLAGVFAYARRKA